MKILVVVCVLCISCNLLMADKEFNKKLMKAFESDTISKRIEDMMRVILKENDDEIQVKERDDNLTQKIHELVATVNLLSQELTNKDLTIVQFRNKCWQLAKDNNKIEKRCE